jgi:hypothetical protein
LLSKRQYRNLLVIHEVYRQQKWMYDNNQNRIDDRIVSISQPHVRPIKRGKARATTEFGVKISASLVDGYTFLDHLSWGNFNESLDLKPQIKAYHKRFGYYPESVHADKIYRTRGNIKYCKSHHIRLSGPPLGRPEFLRDVWPRRKSAKTPTISARLCDLAFSSGKRFQEIAEIVLPLLTTINRDDLMIYKLNQPENNIVDLYPQLTLSLLYAVLPENVSDWPYGIETVLQRISDADEQIRLDGRLIELNRKWNYR